MKRRFLIILFLTTIASLWITPIHEAAHWVIGIILGGRSEGITLWFRGPQLIGKTYNSIVGTGEIRELLMIATPLLLLNIPAATLLWIRRRRDTPSLFPAILAGQGGFYSLWGLIKSYGDSQRLVELGVPIEIVATVGVALVTIATISGLQYLNPSSK